MPTLPPVSELIDQTIPLLPSVGIGLAPAAIGVALSRRWQPAATIGTAVGLAVASLHGYTTIADFPDWPPRISTQIAVWIPVLAGLVAIGMAFLPSRPLRALATGLAGAGGAWWLLRDVIDRENMPGWETVAVVGALTLLWGEAHREAARAGPRFRLLASVLLATSVGGFGLVLAGTGSAALGQLSGILSMFVGGLGVLWFWREEALVAPAATLAVPLMALALWTDGMTFLAEPPPMMAFVLLGVSSLPLLGAAWLRERRLALPGIAAAAFGLIIAANVIVYTQPEPPAPEPDPLEDLYRDLGG